MNKDITPRNNRWQRHGLWEHYYDNGQLHYKRIYLNGKKNGFAEWYWYGKLTVKSYYL